MGGYLVTFGGGLASGYVALSLDLIDLSSPRTIVVRAPQMARFTDSGGCPSVQFLGPEELGGMVRLHRGRLRLVSRLTVLLALQHDVGCDTFESGARVRRVCDYDPAFQNFDCSTLTRGDISADRLLRSNALFLRSHAAQLGALGIRVRTLEHTTTLAALILLSGPFHVKPQL
ncbi:MAG: hypothetical protein AAGE52_03755 [Myxococcota bacterium]